MANDKSNINELVKDEDTTAELEALTDRYLRDDGAELLEASARTDSFSPSGDRSDRDATINQLKTNLRSSSETIDRLQFDIEQFRTRWNGLEAEIKARQEITDSLNRELDQVHAEIGRKDGLLKKRDETIKALKAEIRERNIQFEQLRSTTSDLETVIDSLRLDLDADRGDEMLRDRQVIAQQQGHIASQVAELVELRAHIERSERYADSLRRQLKERQEAAEKAVGGHDYLETRLKEAASRIVQLEGKFVEAESARSRLEQEITDLHSLHAEEIRTIRFELGEAQETVAQQELVTEQLANDLLDTRGYRAELEKMLSDSEKKSRARIEELERQNARLLAESADTKDQISSKNEAINCLLAELARKTQQLESISEIEDVIQEIDGRMSARIEERSAPERDRVTRLLIGTLEGQELRFPLFKDRLTIGRTAQNDIQLNALYVSRRHAVVVTDHSATRVIDWGSRNGVFVNDKRITEHFLANGDILTIGTARFRYEERPKRDS